MTITTEPSRDPTAYLLLHTFLGPVFGTIFVFVAQFAKLAMSGHLAAPMTPGITGIFLLLAALLLPAWFFGFIPALFHAAVMLILRRVIPSRQAWLVLTPLVGAFAVILPLMMFGVGARSEGMSTLLYTGLTGSVAAVCCQAVAWRKRLFPVF